MRDVCNKTSYVECYFITCTACFISLLFELHLCKCKKEVREFFTSVLIDVFACYIYEAHSLCAIIMSRLCV